MALLKVTGSDAIDKAMRMVDTFLQNDEEHVFMLYGYGGIGKKTALDALLKEKK
jgi:replication-associated recombination protein RarA